MYEKSRYAVVLAGGVGKRFWPLSRRKQPKQCLGVDGHDSLVQTTVQRLAPVFGPQNIIVVTGTEMEASIRKQLPTIPAKNFLVEPRPRNTAASVGWATTEVIKRAGSEAVICVSPSDHRLTRVQAFQDSLEASLRFVDERGGFVTLGIKPKAANTGFGYIQVGDQCSDVGGAMFFAARGFTEKPSLQQAQRYVSNGGYLWNSGTVICTAGAMWSSFEEHLPRSALALSRISESPNRLLDVWPEVDAISLDYGIMERVQPMFVLKADFGWTDVGTWSAFAELMPDRAGGKAVAVDVIAIDARNPVVYSPDKLVAVLGLDDVVVVDTKDALLVMAKNRSQEVDAVVAELERRALNDYT